MSWRWEPIILRRNAPSFPNMGRHSSWVPESCCVRQRMHLSSCPVCHILLSIGKNPLTGCPGQMGATTPGDTKCNQNPKMMQILGLVMLELCFLTSPLSHSPKKTRGQDQCLGWHQFSFVTVLNLHMQFTAVYSACYSILGVSWNSLRKEIKIWNGFLQCGK